jgi:ferrous iron transport protein B
MTALIEKRKFLTGLYPARWVALKYLENDEHIRDMGRRADANLASELQGMVEKLSDHLPQTVHSYPEAVIADHRYGYIKSIVNQGVVSYFQDLGGGSSGNGP